MFVAIDRVACHWCSRTIYLDGGYWVDPLATGDDKIWRETCDASNDMMAQHEPYWLVES